MPENTILDKILTKKHAEEISVFNPVVVVDNLLRTISERERFIIMARYGLLSSNECTRSTLEEIGAKINITRERVRQIINGALVKLRQTQTADEEIQRFVRIVEQLLSSFGGVLEENFFIAELLDLSNIPRTEASRQRAVLYLTFLLNELLIDAIEHRQENKIRRAVYAIPGINDKLLTTVVSELVNIVDEAKMPLTEDDLVNKLQERPIYTENKIALVDEPVRLAREYFRTGLSDSMPISDKEEGNVYRAYIMASVELGKNVFGEWGRREWPMIHPKRMNEKIYLVLKHHGQPLHFNELARRINDAKFDLKIAKAPSIHNELILDKRFVLVGRGIYALKEWGYERGTVAEVIRQILNNSDGLKREQIVEAVLKKRIVKKQTILLALLDRNKFVKQSDGRYTLVN